jgi:lipopolysaccharide export system permease protein
LVIARAAGLSAWQFLFPLAAGAFLLGVVSILFINPLASRTNEIAEEMQASLLNQKTGASKALTVPWIRQNGDTQSVIIGAKSALKNGTVLISPVFIILSADGKVTRRIDGARAVLANRRWQIVDGVESGPSINRGAPRAMTLATNLTPELIQERLQAPESVPFFELPQKIAVARALGYPANGFAMQFHSTLALPALLVVMTLIASTVTLKFVRFGQSASMILGGILAGFLLYVVTVLVKAFGGAGIVPPVVAAWFPVGLAFLFGVSFLLHTEDG